MHSLYRLRMPDLVRFLSRRPVTRKLMPEDRHHLVAITPRPVRTVLNGGVTSSGATADRRHGTLSMHLRRPVTSAWSTQSAVSSAKRIQNTSMSFGRVVERLGSKIRATHWTINRDPKISLKKKRGRG